MNNHTQTIRTNLTMKPIGMAIAQQTEMDMVDSMLESMTAMPGITRFPKPKSNWQPFHSSLVDTVRVNMVFAHRPLDQIAIGNPNMKRNGYMWQVRCPDTRAVATVISKAGCTQLVIEVSIPKFLTGQNVLGLEDLFAGTKKALAKIFRLMSFEATPTRMQTIKLGQFKFTRVDFVTHVDCGTRDRARAWLIAAKPRAMAAGKDVSYYGDESLYVGQHSRRVTFKMYLKGPELEAHPMPPNVHDRKNLLGKSDGLVRLEVVLRGNELSDKGLDDPRAWTPAVAHQLMQEWVDRFLPLEGRVPDVARIEELKPSLQVKLRAWLYGDSLAFSRRLTRETYRTSRKEVLEVTGIDIAIPQSPEQQRESFLTMAELLAAGFGFKDHSVIWQDLVDAVKG